MSGLIKSKSSSIAPNNRKSLIDLVNETPLRDPGAFAKQRIITIETKAKATLEKKKQMIKEIEREKEELEHIFYQITVLENRYKQLCDSLNDHKETKIRISTAYDSMSQTNLNILNQTKSSVGKEILDESKLLKWMARNQVEMERGYSTMRMSDTQSDSHTSLIKVKNKNPVKLKQLGKTF